MPRTARIIDAVKQPSCLGALSDDELRVVAAEVREQIIATCARTGGHVASSLGAVDLVVALHSLLNCPHDRLVFDVGHQAYAHKLLTGRLDRFDTLRTRGGISSFTNPEESPYDAHWSGHASDALSLAQGLAKARDLSGGDERVVAVIGDGSISGGMAFEALNQIGQDQTRMVIVLNDNGMSISPSVGGVARHLDGLRSSMRRQEAGAPARGPAPEPWGGGQAFESVAHGIKASLDRPLLAEGTMLYEQLGIPCLTSVDGHDIAALREALRAALDSAGPVLVHVVTEKGKGYAPAQRHPELFHGVGPFDRATGACAPTARLYADELGASLLGEAVRDRSVVAITAAMANGTGLAPFARTCPSRLFDVGICEEHAVGLAAGLATGGKRPVVLVYSTFLQRALDQVVVDVALPRLNVILCVDRAGVVGADGPTHTGAFDLAYLRMIPHMRVMAPSSPQDLSSALHTALALGGPMAIRYPRACAEPVGEGFEPEVWEPGVSRRVREGGDVAILALGPMVGAALAAAEELAARGAQARVVDMRWAKPLDVDAVRRSAECALVVTVEEGSVAGGVGQAVLGELSRLGIEVPTLVLGIPDRFVEQGTRDEQLAELGLDAAGIARAIAVRLDLDRPQE